MYARSLALAPTALALLLLLAPLRAQSPASGVVTDQPLVVPSFTDLEVSRLITSLDAKLASDATPTSDGRVPLWDFSRQLQAGRLSATQESLVLTHLGTIARARPGAAASVARSRHMVSALTVGKVAPDITGTDLNGVEFHLSDYRGSVVVLMFSGDWCGACRSQYPYERQLLELYKNAPFAILGVDSSASAEKAKDVKTAERLTFRSWYDRGGSTPTTGPIATAWNVVGWPSVYVLDERGVIRFVDLRQEDLLKGVRALLRPSTKVP